MLVLGLAIFVLATARRADACTCIPDTGIELSPKAGATIPVGATIFVFRGHGNSGGDHDGTRTAVFPRESRGAVVTGAELVMSAGDWSVTKLSLRATDSQVVLVFAVGDHPPREFRYTVGDPGERVAKRPVASYVEEPSSCAPRGIGFQFEGTAIAYQFDWDDGDTTILTNGMSMIGTFDCFTVNVAPEKLATARTFELRAWFVDGTSQYLGQSRMKLDRDGAVLLPRDFYPPPPPPPPALTHDDLCPLEIEPPRRRSLVLGLVLGAAMSSACWLLWLRRRR